ncbi:MAG: GAF domain-containing protein [Halomonas sp.]|uniref:GAF domain-containing protein n=1 Tax=Halomonas sp. TaxID=1486246 RepID=UPI003F8EA725
MQTTVDFSMLNRQLEALLDTRDWLTNSAQTGAFIAQQLSDLNWVGFYLQRQSDVLSLGPFQGQPACHPIPFSKGVCGAAARQQTTQRIDDVHAVEDHIACDANSRSELVVPVVVNGHLWGVLDLDSPLHGRFTQQDQAGIEALVATFIQQTDLPNFTAEAN